MSRGTVIVLDDQPDNLKLMLHFLAAKGFEVRGAQNTEEADAALREGPADLALVDVALPREDGLHWVLRTRGRPGAPRHFIALTASIDPDVQDRAAKVGCTGYLTKPVSLSVLLAAVQDCFPGSPR